MKIRKGSIVDLLINQHSYYNVKVKKILKYRIVGIYGELICDFQRKDIFCLAEY